MPATAINITGFDNEDIVRDFILKSGDANVSAPYDLTGVALKADIRDQKGVLIMTLSTENNGITINDAANGAFSLHILPGAIKINPTQSLSYDLLMHVGGQYRRLWGGAVKIDHGVTAIP